MGHHESCDINEPHVCLNSIEHLTIVMLNYLIESNIRNSVDNLDNFLYRICNCILNPRLYRICNCILNPRFHQLHICNRIDSVRIDSGFKCVFQFICDIPGPPGLTADLLVRLKDHIICYEYCFARQGAQAGIDP